MKLQVDSGQVFELDNLRVVAGAGVSASAAVGNNDDVVVTLIADGADAGFDAADVAVDSTSLVGTGATVQAVFEELDDAIAALLAQGQVISRSLSFTETAAAGTYTGTIALPAGAILHSVVWETTVAWAADTSVLDAGFTGTGTAYGNDIDVDAVGGDQIFGLDTEDSDDFPAGTNFLAVLVTTGTGGTTGRTRVSITYSVPPTATAAVKV